MLEVGTQLTKNSDNTTDTIAEIQTPPERKGASIYRLASGDQFYTKAHIFKYYTIVQI